MQSEKILQYNGTLIQEIFKIENKSISNTFAYKCALLETVNALCDVLDSDPCTSNFGHLMGLCMWFAQRYPSEHYELINIINQLIERNVSWQSWLKRYLFQIYIEHHCISAIVSRKP